MQNMIDFSKRINEMLMPFHEIQSKMDESQMKLKEAFEPIIEILQSFQEIGERFKIYAEQMPQCLLLIAKHGWFLEFESGLNFPKKIVF